MIQRNFFFDYVGFQKEINPLLEDVDRGDLKSLYRRADEVFKEIKPEEWVLQDQGTGLERFEFDEVASSVVIGYLLLVVLSTYLTPAPSLFSDWGILSSSLIFAGWNEADAQAIVEGFPTPSLIKQDALTQRHYVKRTDPYWHWIIPTQSYKRGWLRLDHIQRFNNLLIDTSEKIEAFDISMLKKMGWVYHEGYDPLAHLKSAYYLEREILAKAEQMKSGLFMVIS